MRSKDKRELGGGNIKGGGEEKQRKGAMRRK